MEIKVNKKDQLLVGAAAVGFISFFLPWIGFDFFETVKFSGFRFVKESGDAWFFALIPLAFLAIVLIKIDVIKNVKPLMFKIILGTPGAILLFLLIRILIKMDFDNFFDYFGTLRSGIYLTIIASVITALEIRKKEELEGK